MGNLPQGEATLYNWKQHEKLDNVLKRDKMEDCLACRLTGKSVNPSRSIASKIPVGAAAFMGLGAYSYFSGQNQLQLQRDKILKSGSRFGLRSRHAGIKGISMVLVGMGMWRLIN